MVDPKKKTGNDEELDATLYAFPDFDDDDQNSNKPVQRDNGADDSSTARSDDNRIVTEDVIVESALLNQYPMEFCNALLKVGEMVNALQKNVSSQNELSRNSYNVPFPRLDFAQIFGKVETLNLQKSLLLSLMSLLTT